MQRVIQSRGQEGKEDTYMDEYNAVMAAIHTTQLAKFPRELYIRPGGCQIPYSAQVRIDSFGQVFRTSLDAEIVHLHLGVRMVPF